MPSNDINDFEIAGPFESGGGIGSGILGALQSGGGNPVNTIASLAGMIPGVGPFLAAGIPLANSIAGLFQTSPEGKNKQVATKLQQTAEQWMQGIEDDVAKGKLDPYVAEQTINNMLKSLAAGAQTEQDKHAVAMAGYAASQHIANIKNTQNWMMNAPYEANQGNFGIMKMGANNYQAIGEAGQKERGQTLLRNLLMGTTTGKEFGNATVAGRLTAGLTDPGNRYTSYLSEVTSNNANNLRTPANLTAPTFSSLREAVGGNNAYSPPPSSYGSTMGGLNNLGDKILDTMRRLGIG